MEGRTVHFNGAGDAKVKALEQSWSVEFVGDRAKATKNAEVLDGSPNPTPSPDASP